MYDISAKSIFSKILATENIYFEYSNLPTAMFDLKSRTLHFPMFKNIDESTECMLITHETGHAIYTPEKEWMAAINKYTEKERDVYKDILNVVEDVRIDKLQQIKYPGTSKYYRDARKYFFENDFFKVNDVELDTLNIVDRINLYSKMGYYYDVKFTKDEFNIYLQTKKTETFKDVEKLADEIFEKFKNEIKNNHIDFNKMFSGSELEASIDSEGNINISIIDADGNKTKNSIKIKTKIITQNDFNNSVNSKKEYEQGKSIKIREKRKYVYTKGWAEIYNNRKFVNNTPPASANLVIKSMINEFNLKKKARDFSKIRETKTGNLDFKKLHLYKTNEDLFLSKELTREHKNHGFILFVDTSGSMAGVSEQVKYQTYIFSLFCKKMNIPYIVYSFSGIICDTSVSHNRIYDFIFSGLAFLGGTPLDNSLIGILDDIEKFRKTSGVDVLNFYLISDGGDDYTQEKNNTMFDCVTFSLYKSSFSFDSICHNHPRYTFTGSILKLMQDAYNVKTNVLFLTSNVNYYKNLKYKKAFDNNKLIIYNNLEGIDNMFYANLHHYFKNHNVKNEDNIIMKHIIAQMVG